MNTWWLIRTATLKWLFHCWTHDDIYPANSKRPFHWWVRYNVRYVNTAIFNCLFPLMNPWWYVHPASLKLLLPSMNIPHVWHDFSFDKGKMRYTDRNFKMTFPLMTTWLYTNRNFLMIFPSNKTRWYVYSEPLKWLSLLMNTW